MQNEDIINILDSMMEQAKELEEASGQGGRDQGEREEAGAAEASDGTTLNHDCIVNLSPYAHPTLYYEEVLTGLAHMHEALPAGDVRAYSQVV